MSGNPTFGLPASQQAVDPRSGSWLSFWYQWAVRISQLSAERPIAAIAVGVSPFVYTSSTIGHLLVSGGTVSSIVLDRSGVDVACTKDVFIPMAANDTVTVTYSVLPTVTFVPNARA